MAGSTPTFPQGALLNGGRYRIDNKLGEGGFGAVYLAMHLELQSPVAIKATTDTDAVARQAFLDEARLLSRLRHPHLPRVTDYFIEGEQPCLVMDYIPGKDLDQVLHERGGPMDEDEVRVWAAEVLEALVYLHSQTPPVIHRDIKPSNIRLATSGGIYLVDFGIAKVGDETTRTQRAGQAVSQHFSPPEQYGGATRTDARSDIYALGATLYALLTNKLPPDVPSRQVGVPFPIPQQDGSAMSPQMGPIIARTMHLNPADRYATAQDLAAALDASTRSATSPTPSTPIVAKTQVISTGHPCPRCGELPITDHAPFCHSCGTPILLTFPTTGRHLHNPAELVAICDAAWADATRHVQTGALTRWLEAYQHEDLLNQIRAAQAHYPNDADAALELFLRPIPPQDLAVTPTGVDFGVCQVGTQPSVTFILRRQSPGYIHGSVIPESLWVSPSISSFRLRPNELSTQMLVRIDVARLNTDDAQQAYMSALVINTNRGSVRLPVMITVSNPPKIRFSETEINLGKVESSRRVGKNVIIINEGGGTVTGKVHAEQPWLTIEAQHADFTLSYHQQATVQFGVTTEKLSPRGQHFGALRWETNAGTLTTNIQIEVTPPYLLNLDDPATAIKQRSDLIKLCDCIQGQGSDHWSRGQEWLRDGRIETALRFLGENDLAQRITQHVQEGDLNIVLESLMRDCGAKPPKHFKDNSSDVVKQITGMFSRKPASVTYAILNTSKRGYLYGYIRPLAKWLTIPQPRFGCLPGEEAIVEILPDYTQRAFGDLFVPIVE